MRKASSIIDARHAQVGATAVVAQPPFLSRTPANTNSFLVDTDAETLPSGPQGLLLARNAESAATPAVVQDLLPAARATAHGEERARLEELQLKLGRPAEALSLPVPSGLAPPAPREPMTAPAPLSLSDAGPAPLAVAPAAFQTPFPGTPILPQPQPFLVPASLQAPVSGRARHPWLKYSVLFAALLLAGGGLGYLLVPPPGKLQVSVKPVDARLSIDGESVTSGPPYRLERKAGVYHLTISRAGYDTIDRDIWIDARQRGHMDFALKPSPSTGFQLTSNPSNARVWLDGRPLVIGKDGKQATTALHASRIRPGPHVVELKGNAQHEPWVHRFVQEPGRTVHLHADLLPIRGLGGARGSSPAARSRGDTVGSSSGKAYDRGKKRSSRSPGTARRASVAGDPFESQARGNQAQSSSRSPIKEEDIFENYGRQKADPVGDCTATISSRPWAEVSIDGRPTGKLTPLVNYSLPCGKHRVSFKNRDLMIERNESITLVPGRPFKKIFMLVETDPWPGSSRAR